MGRGSVLERRKPIVIPRLEDAAAVSVDERDDQLMLLEAAREALEVEWTETLAAGVAAGDHDVLGYPSMVAYLKHRLGVAGGRAHRYVKNARVVLKHAATFSSWKHRQVTSDEAELLFRVSERIPDRYPEAEPFILEVVGDGYDETKKFVDYWLTDTGIAGLAVEKQLERRRCEVTRRRSGMVAGTFELASVEGEGLLTALDALMPPPGEGDTRSTVQRRADALGDLARSFLDGTQPPSVGGERPHINVHTSLPALGGDAGGVHETGTGFVVDPLYVSQLACDASIIRIVFGPESEVLDVGRKTRVIPAGLRRAVVARDRHCVAPGCGRSATWCDVHHIIHWADGGETSIDNLTLLCRYHHTQAHLEQLDLNDLDARPLADTAASRST